MVSKVKKVIKDFAPVKYNPNVAEVNLPNYSGAAHHIRERDQLGTVRYADNYKTIQEAIDSLPSTGGTVMLSAKTYVISSPITISNSLITLQGEGKASIITLQNNSDCNVIEATSVSEGITITSIQIHGNKANQGAGDGNGIFLTNQTGAVVSNVEISNMKTNGIELNNCERCSFTENYIHNCDEMGILFHHLVNYSVINSNKIHDMGDIGIGIAAYTQGLSNYNTITGNTISGCVDNAIDLNGSKYNTIDGNTIEDCYSGVTCDSAPKNVISNNNIFITSNTGIDTNHSTAGSPTGMGQNVIIGNRIDTTTSHGIHLDSPDNTVVGNEVDNIGGTTIIVDSPNTGNLILGNTGHTTDDIIDHDLTTTGDITADRFMLSSTQYINNISGIDMQFYADSIFGWNFTSSKGVTINALNFSPKTSSNGEIDFGASSARWKDGYMTNLDISTDLDVGGDTTTTGQTSSENFVITSTDGSPSQVVSWNQTVSTTATTMDFLNCSGSWSRSSSGTAIFRAFNFSPTIDFTNISNMAGTTFQSDATYNLTTTRGIAQMYTYFDTQNFNSTGGASTVAISSSFVSSPSSATSSGGSLIFTELNGFHFNTTHLATSSTFTEMNGVNIEPVMVAVTGTNWSSFKSAPNLDNGTIAYNTLTNFYHINLSDTIGATNNYGVYSAMTSGSNKWFIYGSGTAESYFNGHINMDDSKKLILGTGQDAEIYYDGTDLVLDSAVVGSGVLRYGTYTTLGSETLAGYITIKDSGGTTRKLAVIA